MDTTCHLLYNLLVGIDGASLISEKVCAPTPWPIFQRELWREDYIPIVDLEGWPQVHATLPGFRILATMLYPHDADRHAELHATLVAAFYATIRDKPDAWTQQPTTAALEILLDARHLGGSQGAVLQRAREVACRGSVAGEA